ncbi:MAG: flagellin [Thermodesulfobacteriota bacterium]|nr:flagellin [Thermodesulfobacteriota bacterium]
MGLRIANNITAMNAHRMLSINDAQLSKSLERLSSGYRINRAADDAAGLAISQSFRANIASFKVASRNTTEASALLQVAEGGMDQIGNMLTRLKELATQAASSNVGTSERAKINSEGNALISEIDRISQATKYGSTALLDGTFGASKTAGTYTGGADDIRVYGDATHAYSIVDGGGGGGVLAADLTISSMAAAATAATWTFSAATATTLKLGNGTTTEVITITYSQSAAQTLVFANLGITFTADCGLTSTQWSGAQVVVRDTGLTSLNVTGANTGTYVFTSTGTTLTLGNGTVTQQITGFTPGTAKDFDFDTLGITLTVGSVYTDNDLDNVTFTVTSSGTSGSTFQVGADNDTNNRLSFTISSLRSTATTGLSLSYDYLDTATEAQSMLDLVDSAISTLSSRRGDVGAAMNRLSYAAANLATTIENVQAAESVIRDVDMAAEMTSFTKSQILLQAGTAMLAQANMAPQSILSLIGQ